MLPHFVETYPDVPAGRQHRKYWEFAHLLLGLDHLGVIHNDSLVLGVGAGHEETLDDLTRWVRWVFATDVYGMGQFQALEGDARMLVDPDHFARCPYNRNRLVVAYMDAHDLRFEPCTFDAAFSSGSIEHVGGVDGARSAIAEMGRVVRPGGIGRPPLPRASTRIARNANSGPTSWWSIRAEFSHQWRSFCSATPDGNAGEHGSADRRGRRTECRR